jgi:hypothetical protein
MKKSALYVAVIALVVGACSDHETHTTVEKTTVVPATTTTTDSTYVAPDSDTTVTEKTVTRKSTW